MRLCSGVTLPAFPLGRRGGSAAEVLLQTSPERLEHLHSRRAEQYDPDRGEDEDNQRDHHLNRGLLRLLLCALAPFDTHLCGLDVEDLRDAHTELVRLDDRANEGGHVRHAKVFVHRTQRLAPRLAKLDLLDHTPEGESKLIIPLLVDLRHRLVEAQTSIDADRHQVERIRQRLDNLLLAALDLAREHHLRQDEAKYSAADAAEDDES